MNLKMKSSFSGSARLLCAFFALGGLSCAAMDSNAEQGPAQPPFNVGCRVLDLRYQKDGQEQTLTVAVWYPTAAQPREYNYGGPTSGMVAVDAAPLAERGPYPMLVFSHGYGGSGLGAVFLTERLAARGWTVAAPDHHDEYSSARIRTGRKRDFDRLGLLRHARQIAASRPGERWKYLYRLDEMRLVLDRMLRSDLFGKLIDRERIAVGGHSFGGFTALGLSGTIKKYHDPRIKAVLRFSTGAGGYLFSKDELGSVKIPSMLFLGEREKSHPRGDHTMSELADKVYQNLPSPKYFLEVRGANHFSFNNRFVDTRFARLLSGTDEQFDVIRRYSIAFLEKHVAGRKGSDRVLERNDPMLVRYLRGPAPGWVRVWVIWVRLG